MKDAAEGLDKKLNIAVIAILIVPVIFGQLFHLAQLAERAQSDIICTLTRNDYLVFMAIESGRNNIASYIPYAGWAMFGVIIMQVVAGIIMLYEIHVIIANRKGKVKESLFKNHKIAILRFFTVLLVLFTVSDYYVSIKKPEAIERTSFVYSVVEQRKDFFMSCGNASTVKLGDQSSLISKDKK